MSEESWLACKEFFMLFFGDWAAQVGAEPHLLILCGTFLTIRKVLSGM